MLAYANGKARVWNTQTMEFRRSTGLDAAEDMLQSGQWTEVCVWTAEFAITPLRQANPATECWMSRHPANVAC